MRNNAEFLLSLFDKGIEVWVDGEQLRFRAPRGGLLQEEKTRLGQQRAEFVELLKHAELSAEPPIRSRVAEARVPLTALQLQIFGSRKGSKKLDGQRAFGMCLRLVGPLDAVAMRESFETVIQRHESLRTVLVETDSGPVQQIGPMRERNYADVDVSRSAAPVEAALVIAEDTFNDPVDAWQGPLFEVKLLKLSRHEHVLVVAMDHLVTDRLSREIILREAWTIYEQAVRGQPRRLPDLPLQFADYAVWQEQTRAAWARKHEAYWRNLLSGVPGLAIPNDDVEPMDRPICIAVDVTLGESVTTDLRNIARREGTSLGLVVFTLYTIAFARWLKQRDLVVQFVVHGRHRPELEGIVGLLSTALHMRLQLHESTTFLDLLKQANVEYGRASDHLDYDRVGEILPGYDTDAHFNWFPLNITPQTSQHQANDIEIYPFPLRVTRPVRFAPIFLETPATISMVLRYRPDMLSADTIRRFGEDFSFLATKCSAAPQARLLAL